MSDTGNTQTPPAPATPPAPVATPPAAHDEDMVYKDQAAVNRAIGIRLEQERTKMATERDAAVAAAKTEAEAEVTTRFNEKLVNTAAKSIARDLKFHDPADALAAIDKSKLPIKADGEVDDAAVKAALEELIKSKPYLAEAPTEDPKGKRPATTRPKLPDGNPDPNAKGDEKLTAAQALRQLRAQARH